MVKDRICIQLFYRSNSVSLGTRAGQLRLYSFSTGSLRVLETAVSTTAHQVGCCCAGRRQEREDDFKDAVGAPGPAAADAALRPHLLMMPLDP